MNDLRLTLTASLATALATSALSGLFAEGAPWLAAALAGVVAVLSGVLVARRLRLPGPLVTLAGAAALLLAATLAAARDTALLGLLPGPAALADLAATLAAGGRDVGELTVPVPGTPGLLLLVLLGAGLVALAVDVLAVTLRWPALAGVPLLALLVLPAGLVPGGIGWLPFALAAAGWLALLLDDERSRVQHWGRVLPGPSGGDPRGHAGRRIGVAALGVSLVAPLLVPEGVQGRLDGGSGWGGFGGVGSASVDTYNPIVRLKGELTRPEPRTVLRVHTDDPDYLRLTALDLYDGTTWSQSPLTAPRSQRVAEGVPLPPGVPASATRAATATVEVLDLSTRWLPVHYPPRVIDVEGDWRYDARSRTVFSSRDETRGLPPYTLTSSRPVVSASSLEGRTRGAESLQEYLVLPRLPGAVVEIAQQVTAEATSDYERAVALQEFFRDDGGFVYDEQVPEGNSGDDLLDFLLNRRGYCEQYAAAMAVLARAVGLPSRVAIGYTAGSEVEPGVWEVSSHDAHAWPEVNLPGAGWIRFEPTPRDDGASPAPPYTVPPEPVEPAPLPDLPGPAPDPGAAVPQRPDQGFTGGSAPQTVAPETGGPGWVPFALLAAVAVLLAPALVHAVRLRRAWAAPARGRGGASSGSASAPAAGGSRLLRRPVAAGPAPALARHRAEVAWRQVREQATDLGLPWRGSDAPRAAADRLLGAAPLPTEAADALRRLAGAVEVARYSPRAPRDEGLRADAGRVRAALRARAGAGARLRAALLPLSTLRAGAGAVGSRVADLLDVLDGAGARVRGVAGRRRPGRLTG